MGIFRFLVEAAAVAAQLTASLSLPLWASPCISSGLGGRMSTEDNIDVRTGCPAAVVPAAAAAASNVHPLDILRVAVGEGWSDGVGRWRAE